MSPEDYIGDVEQVGLRELKNRLSHFVRRVRAGHRIQITDRGEVVAELVPAAALVIDPDIPPRLAEMARRGLIRLGGPNHPGLYPELPPLAPEGTAQRLIDEERGDR